MIDFGHQRKYNLIVESLTTHMNEHLNISAMLLALATCANEQQDTSWHLRQCPLNF
jgi:hypothetical protein